MTLYSETRPLHPVALPSGVEPASAVSSTAAIPIASTDICAEFRAHFNEPVLADQVARLVGYGEAAIDCYLILDYPRRGRVWHTAVGGYFWLDRLRGQCHVKSSEGEDWDDFTRLDSFLTLNGVPPAADFIVDIRHDIAL